MGSRKKLVLKVGTSTLTNGGEKISRGKIEDIAAQFAALKREYDLILVTSGAVAAARQFSDIKSKENLATKQAQAAIGQLHLMRIYQEIFRDYDLNMAQCLLTYYDFRKEENRANTLNTLNTLIDNDYIPIINENDTVATHEIRFGDNDKLAALTAELIGAELLVLATDTDGLFSDDPKSNPDAKIIPEIHDLNTVKTFISDTKSHQGSGGMKSKIEAAGIAQSAGIVCWILRGSRPNFLIDALQGQVTFTKILKKN